MTNDKVRIIIERGWSLFGFEYNGKECHVDPYFDSKTNRQVYLLYCQGEEMAVFSVDEAMNTPFFDGKPLNEIAEAIIVTEY